MTTSVSSSRSYNGAGGQTLNAGDYDTITLSGGGNNVSAGSHDVITINGGNNSVSMQDYGSLTINDSRSVADGFAGNVTFGDTISVYTNDTISLNYSLALGSGDSVTVDFAPSITEHQHLVGGLLSLLTGASTNDQINDAFAILAGSHDTISFSGSNEAISLTLGSGDMILTTAPMTRSRSGARRAPEAR